MNRKSKFVVAQFDRKLEELDLPEIEVLPDDSEDLMDHETFQLLNNLDPRYTRH